jgi:hypothetical protein
MQQRKGNGQRGEEREGTWGEVLGDPPASIQEVRGRTGQARGERGVAESVCGIAGKASGEVRSGRRRGQSRWRGDAMWVLVDSRRRGGAGVDKRGRRRAARGNYGGGGRQGAWTTCAGARGQEELAAAPVAGAEQEVDRRASAGEDGDREVGDLEV